jgi:hypothetical protein
LNILAIDIGTKTGWALGTRDGKVKSGTESFAPGRHDTPGQRWLKFRAFLTDKARSVEGVDAVYYELVLAHARPGMATNVLAAHVYGGFEAMLQAWCELNRIPCYPVAVKTIKKHFTGNGNCKKEAIIQEAIRRGYKPVDDNHADALAILSYAREQEAVAA